MTALALDLLQRTRVSLFWWLAGTLGMGIYVVFIYDTLGDVETISEFYEELPPALREFIGDADISTIDGWLQIEFMSWLPLILAIYGGIFAAGMISREVEQRTIDFVLGLPISRVQFVGSRLLVGMWNVAVLSAVVFMLLTVGVALTGHTPHAERYALASFNAFLLGAALLAAFVALASFVDEQGRVTGITLGATLLLWILSVALQAADAPTIVRWFTPFEHYHSAEAMAGESVTIGSLITLAVATLVASGLAAYWYNRRDIAI
jgi:ABC-type transport system involved in multi-copper enzyme maturation permease subunit